MELNTELKMEVAEETPKDIYQDCLKHELREIQERTEVEDQETFSGICQHIRTLMKDILKLKMDKGDEWSSEVEERRVQAMMLMLSLRHLSRVQKVRVKEAREKTSEFRQGVDGVTLQLQNLLYEVAHLKKEVRRCLDFQSADQEMDLVPLEQFYMEAPESISRPEETVEDAHQQRLARLHWELEQRRDQTQLFDKLTQEKENIASVILGQENKLSALIPRINTILEATKPLQMALNLPLDSRREQQVTAQLLPSPLYTLWIQATAYAEACDSQIEVAISGDTEAAQKLIVPEEEPRTEASDSDNDQETQEETNIRKSRSRKDHKRDTDENKDFAKQLLSLHPLRVTVTINTKDENRVSVTFQYAQVLRFVTAKCSVVLKEKSKSVLAAVLGGDNLLTCLFPEDYGISSPNPASVYQLQRVKVDLKDHLTVIGYPYKWAQNLAGLSFMQTESKASNTLTEESEGSIGDNISEAGGVTLVPKITSEPISSSVLSAEHMHMTVMAIKRRLQARLALHSQLINLEGASCTGDIAISPEKLSQHFPGKISSEFRSWRPLTWQDYAIVPSTQLLRDATIVSPQHLFFKAVFERKHVELEALFAISPDHPNIPPLVSLALKWEGQHSASTSPHVRQMESEVNVHWEELVSSRNDRLHILPLVLYRLAVCLDVFTEASSAHTDAQGPDTQFHKEKIFFRPARGPDRAFPFKYLPKLGVFAQR